MANAGELKGRMQSVRETKKVTDAMYMISSVKMRRAKREVANTEPYFTALTEQIGELLWYTPDMRNRFFHTELDGREHARHGILLITSDKGLAGSYNQTAIKVAQEYMSRHPETVIFIVGEFGRQYFIKNKLPFCTEFHHSAISPSVWEAQKICMEMLEYFDDGRLDEINIIFTDYRGGRPSECVRACLLPLDKSTFRHRDESGRTGDELPYKEFYPDAETVLSEIIPSYLTGFVYSFLVDSYCSEQEARMTAMSTAGNNADEALRKLKMQYNSLRQAAITNEMIEITAGAKSLRGAQRTRKENDYE